MTELQAAFCRSILDWFGLDTSLVVTGFEIMREVDEESGRLFGYAVNFRVGDGRFVCMASGGAYNLLYAFDTLTTLTKHELSISHAAILREQAEGVTSKDGKLWGVTVAMLQEFEEKHDSNTKTA